MEAVPVNYDSPERSRNHCRLYRMESQWERCVFNYHEGSEGGKMDSWVRQCR